MEVNKATYLIVFELLPLSFEKNKKIHTIVGSKINDDKIGKLISLFYN